MKKWFEKLFGKKPIKDKIKKHETCDFGIKEFNKGKRSRAFVEEIKLAEARRRGPKVKDPPPPPPPTGDPQPPPPSSLEPAVLLIDFDGAFISGTSWNYNGDINADHSGLTIEEQELVLAAVKSDFDIFNNLGLRVIVTTDPAIYDAAVSSRRSRIVVTESWEWYGQSGGVAFVGSFGSSDGVGFVFSSLLGYSLKMISEAVSHESAHQLGCYHQSVWVNGVKVNEYNYGGDGVAPICGCSYYQPRGEWAVGTNSYGNIQDDAAVIKNKIQ